ncbi:MAG: peroxiredoxin-like family protein [Xanthobacteraceae bacterium]
MSTTEPHAPVSPGETAPDFALPAVDGTGTVSLADYRGKNSVFLALFIGLWCPFCRRAIAQMAATERELKALGVETLAIVATPPENARLYFKFRPCHLRLAADPELSTHRAYGVPKPASTPEFMNALETTRINPDGEFPEPLPVPDAAALVGKFDGYTETETDRADLERQWPQLKGQFLIDRDGVVRWSNIECATEGLAGLGKFPSADAILAAAQALPRD